MKPLDVIVRDRITPVMKPAGFKKAGRLYRLEDDASNCAVLQISPYKFGATDAAFFVDLHVQPEVYREWLRLNGMDSYFGLWQRRLRPPQGQLGWEKGLWMLNLGDDSSGLRLTETLRSALPDMLALLEPAALLSHIRSDESRDTVRARELGLLILQAQVDGPSVELERSLQDLEARPPAPGSIDATKVAAFVRSLAVQTPGR